MLRESSSKLIGRRYQLQGLLGRGGMGAVYRAVDRLNGQTVALKRVNAIADESDFTTSYDANDFRLALAQEFKLLSSLRHPHVIQVLDYGFDDERQPYFTMELLEHSRNILEASRNLSMSDRMLLVIQLLQALAYLHRRGILHRDLKPANVLVVNGEVKVLDFGLSVMRERAVQEEPSSSTAGTLAYMAPEVLVGGPATERADLYAVGIIACELLMQAHPFQTSDVGILVNEILYTMPDVGKIDTNLETGMVLNRLVQKTPEDRYGDAREVIEALAAALDQPVPVETIAIRESYLQAAQLIGREPELHRLNTAFREMIIGHGSAWLIGGESGVGKSRLMDELRTVAMVEGALVVRGQSSNEGRLAYQMWRPLLRWLTLLSTPGDDDLKVLVALMPDMALLTGVTVHEQTTIDPAKAQNTIVHLLERLLRQHGQPLVIILEDLHWASSESLSLLELVSRLARSLPLMIVGSFRDDERPDLPNALAEMELLRLNRLNHDHIAQLSRAMLGEAGTVPDVVSLLQRETEGNVLFLIEVVRALAEEAGQLDQIGRMTLPEHVFAGGVRLIIQRRLQRLPGWTHRLLQLAAISGRQQDTALLRLFDPGVDLDRWLAECANAAVLEVQDGEWQFAHDKLRDALLHDMDRETRRELHGHVARVIEQHYGAAERASLLAYHWRQAGDERRESYFAVMAGEQMLRSGSYQDAVILLERALALTDEVASDATNALQRRAHLLRRLAEAHLGFGGYQDAQAYVEESAAIARLIHDRRAAAAAEGLLGDVAYALSEYEQARHHYQEALSLHRAVNDLSGTARILNSLGNVAYDLGDHAVAKQLYQQSLSLSREIGDQWGMAGSLSQTDISHPVSALSDHANGSIESMSWAADQPEGEPGAATIAAQRRQIEERREAQDTLGMIRGLITLSSLYAGEADYHEAGTALRQGLQAARKLDDLPIMLNILLEIARLRITEDKKEQALELLAFVLYHPETTHEDEAERLAFDLQEQLSPDVVNTIWERGKSAGLDAIVDETVRSLRRM